MSISCNNGIARRKDAFEEMVRSYAREKGYELHYHSDPINFVTAFHFTAGNSSCTRKVYWLESEELYIMFDKLVKWVEAHLEPGIHHSVELPRLTLRDSTDTLSYSYSYMKPIAEACTCKTTRNGLEISGQLTNYGKMFANMNFLKDIHIPPLVRKPEIKNVLFKNPATIVFWTDGTKTVVKCQNGEEYDPEKGLAMAISKKTLGNKRDYYHTFLKWLKKYEKENPSPLDDRVSSSEFSEAIAKLGENARKVPFFGMSKDVD